MSRRRFGWRWRHWRRALFLAAVTVTPTAVGQRRAAGRVSTVSSCHQLVADKHDHRLLHFAGELLVSYFLQHRHANFVTPSIFTGRINVERCSTHSLAWNATFWFLSLISTARTRNRALAEKLKRCPDIISTAIMHIDQPLPLPASCFTC